MKIALREKLAHPYLEKYVSLPKLDEDKLLLFYAIFDEIDLSDDIKESYIITVMLVQIALDTHDNVTVEHDIDTAEFVQRQLTVLAGDYYSGLYYFMLSEVKDFKMVRALAMAIREINEHKISLYHDNHANMQSILDSLLIVETTLFNRVADLLKLNHWKLLSTNFLTYKRLSHEKFHLENEGKLPENQFYKSPFSLTFLNNACKNYFEETISLLESGFFTPEMKDLLFKRLQSIHFHETLHLKKTVEEGL
ncbi:heptaprenyl diphosphate synthase component 1 [uncultured Metabacillus sp.]|uniref:heptaprenyl diphosphate synthase component 1 n=1 Tax=Metabacillus sp. Hm71 TaxID=3450743 RepID=UPI00261C1F21|nr:heptaprenyl diphosphate synthase component 1 [uncultured Metabacillus sp.]